MNIQDSTLQTPRDLDLTACEREPIHIPGSIQPHGVLVAVRLSDGTVTYASANAAETFGLDQASLIAQPFREAFPALAAEFEAQLAVSPSAASAGAAAVLDVPQS